MRSVRRVLAFVILAAACLLPALQRGEAVAACSQPVTEGARPILRDCIYVARASIGLEDCAACLCDVDGSGDVHMTDALACLRYAVGNDVTLACPDCSVSTTTSTTITAGCASCNDLLEGTRDYEDLCPLAKHVYDEMIECPDSCESCICTRQVPENPPCLASDMLQCLRQCLATCGEMTQNCREQ
jgi:hypothetical protein